LRGHFRCRAGCQLLCRAHAPEAQMVAHRQFLSTRQRLKRLPVATREATQWNQTHRRELGVLDKAGRHRVSIRACQEKARVCNGSSVGSGQRAAGLEPAERQCRLPRARLVVVLFHELAHRRVPPRRVGLVHFAARLRPLPVSMLVEQDPRFAKIRGRAKGEYRRRLRRTRSMCCAACLLVVIR
jgi:hypothetical protein